MPPKPNPQVSEPLAGYAHTGKQAEKAAIAQAGVKQAAFLREALDDLAELDEYAAELNMPPPSTVAKESARAFVEKAVCEVPFRYAISPWDEGKVVVYAQDKQRLRVSAYFNAEGGVSGYITCSKGIGNKKRHFSQVDKDATAWLFDALQHLGK